VFNNCAVARAADGQTSQDCASTAVVVPGLDVRVGVAGSDTVTVGDRVKFEITVTNRSNLPATGLVITDHFDPGLEHDAAASPIEKDLGQLAGGQSHVIGVTFGVTQPGRLCNRVEIRGDAGIRGAAQGCVTAVMGAAPAGQPPEQRVPSQPPPTAAPPAEDSQPQRAAVQVKVTGPAAPQNIDAVAEFFIDISNTGERGLTNLTLTAASEAPLVPVQATDGYEWDDRENLVWRIPSLAAGKSVRLQLNSRCQKEAQKACVRVKVAAQEGTAAEEEACVEIRRGQSQLEVTVDDLADPITAGKDLTYDVQITNKGSVADRNVALTVAVPPEMAINKVGTMGPVVPSIEGQIVRFPPVPTLPAGETLKFKVRVNTLKAGQVKVEAVFKSEGQPQPRTKEQETTVLDPSE
jgi:uncharacterized repeat protein (TIGR01451 family)